MWCVGKPCRRSVLDIHVFGVAILHRRCVEICSHLNRTAHGACRAERIDDQATNEATAIQRIGEKQTGRNNKGGAYCIVLCLGQRSTPQSKHSNVLIEPWGAGPNCSTTHTGNAHRDPAPVDPRRCGGGKNGKCSAPFSTKDKGFPCALPCYPGFSPPPAFIASLCNCRPWAERKGGAD